MNKNIFTVMALGVIAIAAVIVAYDSTQNIAVKHKIAEEARRIESNFCKYDDGRTALNGAQSSDGYICRNGSWKLPPKRIPTAVGYTKKYIRMMDRCNRSGTIASDPTGRKLVCRMAQSGILQWFLG